MVDARALVTAAPEVPPLTSLQVQPDPARLSAARAMILYPVVSSKHKVLAIIQLTSKESAWGEEELELVSSFAVALAVALEQCSRSSTVGRS